MMNQSTFSLSINKLMLRLLVWEILFWLILGIIYFTINFFAETDQILFKFENKFFLLFLLIPFYFSVYRLLKWREKTLQKLGKHKTLSSLVHQPSFKQTFWKLWFTRSIIVFIILALTQPLFGHKTVNGKTRLMELVVAIDISNSMNVCDIEAKTSRLKIVKRALNQLVNNLNGERIGLVVFAGGTYTHLPLTTDYDAAKLYIQELETAMLKKQGTNIAAALEESVQMFSNSEINKAIIVVTDGEHHEGNFNEALEKLKKNKINLSLLGIGTEKGGPVPNNPLKPELGYKKDENGNYVNSKVNAQLILQLAKQANGIAVIERSAFPDMHQILVSIKKLKNYTHSDEQINTKFNWFQVMVFLALLCLFGVLGVNQDLIFNNTEK